MTEKTLSIDLIRLDGDTQSRVRSNEDALAEYTAKVKGSDDWPEEYGSVDVFFDGAEYFMSDGFHRTLAAIRAGRSSIPCRVHSGSAWDAFVFGIAANSGRGVRQEDDDKRYIVGRFLDSGQKMTQAEIAEQARVSLWLVKDVVAKRKEESLRGQSPPTTGSARVARNPNHTSSGGSGVSDDTDPGEPDMETDTEDYGKCPNCAGTSWKEDEDGVYCAKCQHPHGEPAGDVDKERITTQRQKTVKTAEALIREIDDLHLLCPSSEHDGAIEVCKALLKLVKGWK